MTYMPRYLYAFSYKHINKMQLFLEAGKKNDLNMNILKDNRLLRYINRYAARHYGNI